MSTLRDLFADTDGRRVDEMAGLSIIGVLAFICLAIYSVVVKNTPFDPSSYGTGLGAAVGGAAIGIGLKGKMERGATKEDGDR